MLRKQLIIFIALLYESFAQDTGVSPLPGVGLVMQSFIVLDPEHTVSAQIIQLTYD